MLNVSSKNNARVSLSCFCLFAFACMWVGDIKRMWKRTITEDLKKSNKKTAKKME